MTTATETKASEALYTVRRRAKVLAYGHNQLPQRDRDGMAAAAQIADHLARAAKSLEDAVDEALHRDSPSKVREMILGHLREAGELLIEPEPASEAATG